MFRVFKITKAGNSPLSPDLLGLLIVQADDGFHVLNPEQELEPPKVLANSGILDIKPPFVTLKFKHKSKKWLLSISTVSTVELSGHWKDKDDPGQDEDSWTATGTGTGQVEGDEAKASYAGDSA
jgi:hypothetical protein